MSCPYGIGLILLLTLLAACQPAAPSASQPTVIPFPTVTPGRRIEGILPVNAGLPLDGSGLANPATAVAQSNLQGPTPDLSTCPPHVEVPPPATPATASEMGAWLQSYLTSGASPLTLPDVLAGWDALGESGLVRADLDFTGEGVTDVVATYQAADGSGAIIVLSCVSGRYMTLFESVGDDGIPVIDYMGDINYDARPDILFSMPDCSEVEPFTCANRSDVRTFSRDDTRFISLLNGAILSSEPPTVNDIDNDRVLEIVVRLTETGDITTGPLRTGVNIYDWNGLNFVLSIIQLDPPRFQIQVIQEADRAFARQDMEQAIRLYELALTDTALRFWLNDEPVFLKSYVYYRLLLAYAFTDNSNLLTIYQTANAEYPDPATAPVYIAMLNAFWNGWQVTNNLRSACEAVQPVINTRPESVAILNRYGSRSPIIAAADLCPF